jgi:hypothetical protein
MVLDRFRAGSIVPPSRGSPCRTLQPVGPADAGGRRLLTTTDQASLATHAVHCVCFVAGIDQIQQGIDSARRHLPCPGGSPEHFARQFREERHSDTAAVLLLLSPIAPAGLLSPLLLLLVVDGCTPFVVVVRARVQTLGDAKS